MKKYDIAIAVNADNELKNAGISNADSIKCIKKAGFKKVFISWMNNTWGESQEKIYNIIKSHGLEIVFAHVGYRGVYDFNKIWEDDKEGDEIAKTLINDLKILKEHNINIAVIHTYHRKDIKVLEIGLKRWKKVVKEAEKLGIIVAIENLRHLNIIEYLIDNIKSENLRICYDAGHDHCNTNDSFNFEKYGNKIIATHIHDNDGERDSHFIPLHGDINWDKIMKNLKNSNKNLTLSAEVYYRLGYRICSSKKFYKTAYKSMKKLYKKYENF